jgi:mono/diheme cytochrome c family protein
VRALSSAVAMLILAGLAVVVSSCSQSEPLTAAQRGKQVYLSNCILCHNPDPTKPGSQGPAIAGSSRELVEARVVHAAYPPGYTPQRTTKAMVALPHLASRVDDLTAFLTAAKDGAQ